MPNEELEQVEVEPRIIGGDEPKPTISLNRIDALCQRLINIRITVAEAELDVADAEAKVEETKARIVGEGYATEAINGSNKQTREAQEAKLLADSEELAQAKLAVREAKRELAIQQANLAGTEGRISLYRAFLYSSARMPR